MWYPNFIKPMFYLALLLVVFCLDPTQKKGQRRAEARSLEQRDIGQKSFSHFFRKSDLPRYFPSLFVKNKQGIGGNIPLRSAKESNSDSLFGGFPTGSSHTLDRHLGRKISTKEVLSLLEILLKKIKRGYNPDLHETGDAEDAPPEDIVVDGKGAMDSSGFLFSNLKSTTPPAISPQNCSASPPIILNKSVDCNDYTLNKVSLSDDQLVHVLADQGGSYVRDYMATDHNAASANFKNLVDMADSYDDDNFKVHPTDWLWDYHLTKAKILEALEISHLQVLAYQNQPNLLPVDKYVQSNFHHWANRTDNNTAWAAALVHRILSQFVRASNISSDQNDTVAEDDDDSGTDSKMEYCQKRGSESSDGYLHMCTTCSHTTTLPADRFPRVLNEAVCYSVDSGCLFVGDTPHGSCRQNVFYMNMLRKRAGKCMMVIHDDATVLTDEWELYSQPIRVSCECLVNKRSPVAKNVNPN